MQNLLDELTKALAADKRLVIDGKLAKNKIIELALALDESLIKLLLKNDAIKKHFFREVDGILVFDKIEFQKFVSNKQFLPDSYTAFKNKIGLTANGEYLTEAGEVVLVWPYKDCVLEGDQTKEDEKRKEIFWNRTLAPDEIDRLLSPKVLTNFKRYDKDGEHKVIELSINDNYIIKGNNLLALCSITKVYAGKVKLIYIDPPYNTGSDSFLYNDSFNHSTWLTFMKNRLEIAKELLAKDGAIFIQLDDNEVAYAKVMCDEIFGKENYCNQIALETNSAFGYKGTADNLFKQAGYILFYCKNKLYFKLKKVFTERNYDVAYRFIFEDISLPEAEWKWKDLGEDLAEKLGYKSKKGAIESLGEENFKAELANYAVKNADRVFRTASVTGGAFKKRLDTIKKSKRIKNGILRHPNDDMDYMFIGGERVLFYKERLVNIDGELVPGVVLTDLWTDVSIEGIAKEGGVQFERGKKPEELIRRLIELTTEEDDLVADFFCGSGTTLAVAHKMKRHYIGIEQLDYTETLPLERLKNVVNGDQSGISRLKEVNWQGGGYFVYCELKKANQEWFDHIKSAKSSEELQQLWRRMQGKAFINYEVELKAFNKAPQDFNELSLDDKKEFLIKVLDKNQLYVNYSEIDDKEYGISIEDKKLNAQFYELK